MNHELLKQREPSILLCLAESRQKSTKLRWLGVCVDWSKIGKRDYLNAMIEAEKNSQQIHELIKKALTDKIDDREIFMKGIDYSYYYEQED